MADHLTFPPFALSLEQKDGTDDLRHRVLGRHGNFVERASDGGDALRLGELKLALVVAADGGQGQAERAGDVVGRHTGGGEALDLAPKVLGRGMFGTHVNMCLFDRVSGEDRRGAVSPSRRFRHLHLLGLGDVLAQKYFRKARCLVNRAPRIPKRRRLLGLETSSR